MLGNPMWCPSMITTQVFSIPFFFGIKKAWLEIVWFSGFVRLFPPTCLQPQISTWVMQVNLSIIDLLQCFSKLFKAGRMTNWLYTCYHASPGLPNNRLLKLQNFQRPGTYTFGIYLKTYTCIAFCFGQNISYWMERESLFLPSYAILGIQCTRPCLISGQAAKPVEIWPHFLFGGLKMCSQFLEKKTCPANQKCSFVLASWCWWSKLSRWFDKLCGSKEIEAIIKKKKEVDLIMLRSNFRDDWTEFLGENTFFLKILNVDVDMLVWAKDVICPVHVQ